jgi:predicted DsbA family dithiol-disulfide isomerase
VSGVNVEIWSDIACPWCAVGKRRFEKALAQFDRRDDVTVTWRSFELDPQAPAERPGPRDAHLAEKYGMSVEQAREMHDRMTETAAGEGLDFRFDRARDGNTFDAHRIVHLARAHGLQDEMNERLLTAHFSEGELVSDRATLKRLALDAGLPEDEIDETLATDRYADDVRADETTAYTLGISAVPTFVVDRRIGVSGAQPPEVLGQLLARGFEDAQPR